MTGIALVTQGGDRELRAACDALAAYLRRCGSVVSAGREQGVASAGAGGSVDAVVLVTDQPLPGSRAEELLTAAAAGRPLLLLGPTLASCGAASALAEAAGLAPGVLTAVHEARVRPGPDAGEVATRMAGETLVRDRVTTVDKTADDVAVQLRVSVGLVEQPVATWRPGTGVGAFTLGGTAPALADPAVQRLVHRWLRAALGVRDAPSVGVGLLGYGAIGAEHNAAIQAVEGLRLAAVCDRNAQRLDAARAVSPDLAAYDHAEALLRAPDVDLVVVSSPPDTHARWALRALDAGKHVVVEKPFALSTDEADTMVAVAAERDRVLAVYQNRRWDADYLAVKQLVRSGAVGEVFHVETFVGSYGHPCNYWHSDEAVSGGAIYDWGSHYLDWVLDLLPGEVDFVTATTHKRVWHDVTNADHSRVTLRFTDGVEAQFVHSDLAAAAKPKWYVLGTGGASRRTGGTREWSPARRSARWSRTRWRPRTPRPRSSCTPRTARGRRWRCRARRRTRSTTSSLTGLSPGSRWHSTRSRRDARRR